VDRRHVCRHEKSERIDEGGVRFRHDRITHRAHRRERGQAMKKFEKWAEESRQGTEEKGGRSTE
jgi:hypothetical protein